MLEIRPARLEEMGEFARIASTSLALDAASFATLLPDWTLCAFEDGRLATTYGAWPLTMRFNGRGVSIAGITCVSTNPVYRRRGYLRRIMEIDFARLEAAKLQPLAVLYASQAAIYQRFGYGIVSTHYRYRVEPRYLQFARREEAPGSLREASKEDEFGLLVDLYRRFREQRTGYVHRGRPMWEQNALGKPPPGHVKTVLVYEEDGEPQGYVIYTTGLGRFDGPGPGQVLSISDLVWLTPAAYRSFWERFARFDLVHDVVWNSAPQDDPLPHLLLEPRMLHATAHDGLLARIIDVAGALTARPYPEETLLRFELVDEMAPWNGGRWQIETGEESEVTSLTRAGSPGKSVRGARTFTSAPDLTLDVNTLAMLVFGQISASEAASMGRVDVHDAKALSRWDNALRTKHRPFCADQF
jgi:predicted acetyltransferase